MPPSPRLWKLTLTCPAAEAEAWGDYLGEEALSLSVMAPPRHENAELETIYDAPPDETLMTQKINLFADQNGFAIPAFSVAPIENLDWIKKVCEEFPPLPIARWVVFGAAHKEAVQGHPLPLQIDATSAFGTGEHPTTRGCLEVLDDLLTKGLVDGTAKLLDIGCGSGILSMAFAKACGGKALGIEIDEQSVEIAQENVLSNNLLPLVTIKLGDGYHDEAVTQGAPFDIIMANIFADPLCEMAPDLARTLKTGGYAILSGILGTQKQAVIGAHTAQGLTLLEERALGEWAVLLLKKGGA